MKKHIIMICLIIMCSIVVMPVFAQDALEKDADNFTAGVFYLYVLATFLLLFGFVYFGYSLKKRVNKEADSISGIVFSSASLVAGFILLQAATVMYLTNKLAIK